MINITRSGNNVIVTSDNPRAFNIGNGELSIPMNSIYYFLDDESDFIQFNSLTEDGEILFNGVIGDIQVNGNIVTREDIKVQLDSVLNSSAGGSSAGVESVNGISGAVTLKTINGNEITGLGDITIEGGGSSGIEYIAFSETPSDYDKFYGGVKFFTSWVDLNGDGSQETLDVRIGGKLIDGSDASALWYGFTSSDNSILLGDYSSRLDLKVNEWVGTQSEYDALGSYDSGCTYYITE